MYSSELGFTVDSFDSVIQEYYQKHMDEWGDTSLTFERFRGSKEYELYYAAAQLDLHNQGYFSQAFEYLKQYITVKNEKIQRPTPINDRIIARFAKEDFGLVCSIRPPASTTAGILAIALDYGDGNDPLDYGTLNQRIADTLISDCAIGGIWTYGDISKDSTISNGQSFTMNWTSAKHKTCNFKYTIIRSRNSQISELPVNKIRDLFVANFAERYAQGLDIEPQKYLTLRDLPWASSVEAERMTEDDMDFTQNIYKSPYDEVYTASLTPDNIIVQDAP